MDAGEAYKPIVLHGAHVILEPLTLDHLDDLVVAATVHRPDCDYTHVPTDAETMEQHIAAICSQQGRMPFAQRRVTDGRVVGSTGFMSPTWWLGRFAPDEVEIGGTWLDRTAQRTGINTEAKLLLLTHAFEVWKVWRVDIKIDERNEASRRATERIGATFEGVLRHHQMSRHPDEHGRPRNTAMYSIIDSEWPSAKERIEDLVARH
jgi:RimJ/RimL family protein N-acetyltransferase